MAERKRASFSGLAMVLRKGEPGRGRKDPLHANVWQ
jgi:hypothetical protein